MPGIKQRGRQVPAHAGLTSRWRAAVDDYVIALTWSPDGTQVAAAAISGATCLFDGLSGQPQVQLPGHTLGTTALSWHPQRPVLASSGQDGKVYLWDTTTGQRQMVLPAGTSWVERVAWSPQGDMLAAAAGRTIYLWDAAGHLLHAWRDHASTVADIQWQPGGTTLAAAAYGGVTLWLPEQATPLHHYQWQGSTLVLAWSPDSTVIATGDQDCTVHFWYVKSGKDLQMWGYETKVLELTWHASSRYLATGGGSVPCVWDCKGSKGPEGTTPVQLQGHSAPVAALAYQHVGALLASGGSEGGVALWQPASSNRFLAWADLPAGVSRLAWSPDDRHLAVGGADGTVEVFAVGTALK